MNVFYHADETKYQTNIYPKNGLENDGKFVH